MTLADAALRLNPSGGPLTPPAARDRELLPDCWDGRHGGCPRVVWIGSATALLCQCHCHDRPGDDT